jgi:hypothetical protein
MAGVLKDHPATLPRDRFTDRDDRLGTPGRNRYRVVPHSDSEPTLGTAVARSQSVATERSGGVVIGPMIDGPERPSFVNPRPGAAS